MKEEYISPAQAIRPGNLLQGVKGEKPIPSSEKIFILRT